MNAGCGWPHNGEFDLMEYWSTDEKNVYSTIHSGDCKSNTHISNGVRKEIDRKWMESFHTYVAEWYDDKVTFKIDEVIIGTTKWGELDLEHKLPFIEPDRSFLWILNLTISKAWGKSAPTLENFPHQEMLVDYVKTYTLCENNNDPDCQQFTSPVSDVNYNSNEGETAKADLIVYPNPVRIGENATVKLMLYQDCDNVSVNLYSLSGALIERIGVDMKLNKDAIFEKNISNTHLPSGIYIIDANFKSCGQNNGQGNQVYKILVN